MPFDSAAFGYGLGIGFFAMFAPYLFMMPVRAFRRFIGISSAD